MRGGCSLRVVLRLGLRLGVMHDMRSMRGMGMAQRVMRMMYRKRVVQGGRRDRDGNLSRY